jgi:predicted anti-sigma-YlaC factor YlaD
MRVYTVVRDSVHTHACERARSWVSLGLDGELSELESRLLRAHLGRCVACMEFAAEIEALVVELRTAPPEAVPGTLQVPAWRRRPAAPVTRVASRAAAVAAAAAAGIAMFSLGVGSVGDVSDGTTQQAPIIVDATTLSNTEQEIADFRDARRATLLSSVPSQAAASRTGTNAL